MDLVSVLIYFEPYVRHRFHWVELGLLLTDYGIFGYCLFCWNWKIIAENTVDKGKS